MGIIKTQAIQSTLFNYLGVLVGFLNSTLLMPNLLSKENIGLFGFLNSTTIIFSTIFSFGVPLITVKMFPKFREIDNPKHSGFFAFSFLMTVIGGVMGISVYLLLEDNLIADKNEASFFSPFVFGFSALFLGRLFFKNFDPFVRMLYNSVLGAITENLLSKVILTMALGIYWYVQGYEFKYLFIFYIIGLSIPGITSLAYIISKKSFNFDVEKFHLTSVGLKREMATLGLFGLLGSMGTIIVLEVDRIMISNMLGLEYTGIYSTVFFFGIFVSIPAKSVKRIAIVVLSDAWKENNLSVIKEVYSKSCLNQFLLAVYLFLGIWVNIDFVFEIIPPEYAAGKYVILFIGIGQLFDMLTGVNTEIISTSKYFRYNTFFITFLITLVIILNYIFIPIYGINGAAAASALAVILINIMRYAFLYIKLDHQPFDIRIGKIVALGLICFGAISMVPIFDNVFINILLRGTMLTLLYWIPALYFRISEDIYSTFVKVIQSILGSKNND